MTTKYDILRSLVLILKHYNITVEEVNNQFKITCQNFDVFITCYVRSGEIINNTFIHVVMSTLGVYPEDIVPEKFYFQWPDRNKIQIIYQRILKEFNSDHNYLRFLDLRDNNFKILRLKNSLDKVHFLCAENVKSKPIRNYSKFDCLFKHNLFFFNMIL